MKTLIWKEWRENRMLLLSAPLLVVVLTGGYIAYCVANRIEQSWTSDLPLFLLFVWVISALICGATLMAPEVDSGTLQFLSAMPLSRKRIWWTKLLTSVVILFFSLCTSTIAYLVTAEIGVGAAHLQAPDIPLMQGMGLALTTATLTLPLVASGALVTMLVDRTISAVVVAAALAIALGALIVYVTSKFSSDPFFIVFAIAMLVLWLLASSYRIFVHGETLKTNKRFLILLNQLAPVVTIGAALVIAWFLIAD